MEGTKVLTTAEFAEIMGVTDRCVRKWCERGAVKASRSGSRSPWRIQFNEKRFREIADENAAMNSQMAAERGRK